MEESPKSKRPEVNLETHRFSISPESMVFIKNIREIFRNVQEKFPDIVAMSFFGSRTRNQENVHSDIDLIIFYDEDLAEETDAWFDDGLGSKRQYQIYEFLRNYSKAVHVDMYFTEISVSDFNTESDLEFFKTELDVGNFRLLDKDFYLGDGSPFSLAARFLLGVGDVYSIREEIINYFEKFENGNRYWQELMRVLSLCERPQEDRKHKDKSPIPILPPYSYPQTLAEGREYFLKLKKKDVPIE